MLSKEKISRINELSKKSKTVGLTKAEQIEQQKLRQEYIKKFRQSFEDTLHTVKVIDPEGKDVTPEKLRQSQQQRKDTMLH